MFQLHDLDSLEDTKEMNILNAYSFSLPNASRPHYQVEF